MVDLPGGWRKGPGLQEQHPYDSHGFEGGREQSKPEAICTEEAVTSDPGTHRRGNPSAAWRQTPN